MISTNYGECAAQIAELEVKLEEARKRNHDLVNQFAAYQLLCGELADAIPATDENRELIERGKRAADGCFDFKDPEWISVEKRLPEDTRKVWLTYLMDKGLFVTTGFFYGTWKSSESDWVCEYGKDFNKDIKIVAWAEIIEPNPYTKPAREFDCETCQCRNVCAYNLRLQDWDGDCEGTSFKPCE